MQRERWASRSAFILAAIGSAAGLGNAWRFPYMCYSNGGGAFLIPYFVALLTTGLPILVMEYALGQKTQKGAPQAFGSVKKPFERLGWFSLLVGGIVATYYMVIMGWTWVYLKASFKIEWAENAGAFFQNKLLNISSGPGDFGGLVWPVVIGLALSWAIVYYILRNGLKGVGKAVLITVPLPVILLIILAVRGLTLPGAIEGINYYLTPDFSKLLDVKVWLAAYSQVFFSLSIGFGIMIAYASYMNEKSDVTNNALITVLADSGISFLAGFAIFGTLGHMAHVQGVSVADVATGGPGLAFVVYPQAISLLPGGDIVTGIFGVIFFLMILTLGIDTAFSIVEAVIVVLEDKWGWKRKKVTFWFCTIGFLLGLLYCTRAGLYWLDIIDHWMNSLGLIMAGLLEVVLVGWFMKPERLRNYFNPISDFKFNALWDISIKYLSPLVLGALLITQFIEEFKVAYGGYDWIYRFVGGWGLLLAAAILASILAKQKNTYKLKLKQTI